MHESIGEVAHGFARRVEFPVGGKGYDSCGALTGEGLALRVVECAGEDLLFGAFRCGHRVYGLAEEGLGCAVKGEEEEEGLKADRGAIEGYLIDKFLNVDFEGIQVLDLSFGEIRSYERLSPMKSSKSCI